MAEWQNSYCGPYALSRVAGITPNEAAARIRSKSGQRAVYGANWIVMGECLREDPGVEEFHEFKCVMTRPDSTQTTPKQPSLEAFAAQYDDGSRYWVVTLNDHYVVLRRGKIYDSARIEVRPLAEYSRKTAKVVRAWRCKL